MRMHRHNRKELSKIMFEDCTKDESELLRLGFCPDCKREGFLEGPHGGLCVNIMCANPKCGSRFNIGPMSAQRISDPSPLRASSALNA